MLGGVPPSPVRSLFSKQANVKPDLPARVSVPGCVAIRRERIHRERGRRVDGAELLGTSAAADELAAVGTLEVRTEVTDRDAGREVVSEVANVVGILLAHGSPPAEVRNTRRDLLDDPGFEGAL